MRTHLSAALLPLLLSAMLAPPAAGQSEPPKSDGDLPDGVEQILPRGRIAAVVDPEFVPADEAEISDDAWVLGVVIDGRARAYSLNLLNRHEVVNDRIGQLPIAAVW